MLDPKEVINKVGKVKSFTNLSLQNLKDFNEAVKVVKEFENSASKYAKTIFTEKFVNSKKGWLDILSNKDIEINQEFLNSIDDDTYWVYCYKNKTFYDFYNTKSGWFMGDISGARVTYNFNENNNLVVTINWKTQKARFDHEPWHSRERIFEIDYLNSRVISVKGDSPKVGY